MHYYQNKSRYQDGNGFNLFALWKRFFGQFFKEIMFQNNTDTHQQSYVQAFALENVINICSFAGDLRCQPGC